MISKSKARYNLGIGESYSLNFEEIYGLIDNQEDLIIIIHNSLQRYIMNILNGNKCFISNMSIERNWNSS